jgi:hypothetical protein
LSVFSLFLAFIRPVDHSGALDETDYTSAVSSMSSCESTPSFRTIGADLTDQTTFFIKNYQKEISEIFTFPPENDIKPPKAF